MAVVIRAMRVGDMTALVPLHHRVFRDSRGTRAGRGWSESLLRWYATAPDCVALVAEESSQILGYTFGGPEGHRAPMFLELKRAAARALFLHPKAFLNTDFRQGLASLGVGLARYLLRRRGHSQFPGRTFQLTALGVAGSAARRGIGELLMSTAEHFISQQGFTRVEAAVFQKNVAIRGLLEKRQWSPIEHPGDHPDLMGYALEIAPISHLETYRSSQRRADG